MPVGSQCPSAAGMPALVVLEGFLHCCGGSLPPRKNNDISSEPRRVFREIFGIILVGFLG